jgi:tRNA A-37 threonylcarbamoyl transferase component Bud32
LMKRIGLNLVRLAHYPQHPEFLNACDELGILVYAEIASWKSVKQGAWLAAACRQWRAMILRDRHHPSIILWGMGNESRSGPGYRRMHTVAHELDGSRETVYAENHLHRGIRWRTLKLPDVLGVNYEIDRLEDARRLGRGPVLMSECSNCPRTYRGDPESETQQVETYQRDLDGIEAHDFAAGYCLWSFNDYATQRKERYIRCSGLVDAWRLPKPSAAYLSSRIKGSPTEAAISPGETTAIVIEAGAANYSATSRETVSLLCRAVDTHGNTATGWKGELAISLEGPARERLHNENAKLPMAAGSGRLFVTSTGIAGHVTVSATHPDLGQGMLTIEFSDSPPVIPELPLHDDIPHVALAAWASDRITTDKNERVDIRFAPGEDDLPDLIKRYLNDDLPGTTTVRAHKWGGRVVSAPVPPTGRTFFFKSFPANSPRFLHKPLRARHTLLQEDRLRAAGFAAPRSIGLALKRRAGVLVDSLVVSESAGDLPSLATLINDGEDAVRDRSLRRTLLKAAATEIGRFHRSGLFHGDMHLNNLLCRQSDGEFTFVWIDNEEGRSYESLPDEKRIHDLNHLNRQRHTLSRSERMLMWKTYIDATNVLSQDRAASILRKTISQSQAYMRKRGWL